MGILNSTSDRKSLKEAARAAGAICDELCAMVKPGITTVELEEKANSLLRANRSSAPFRQVDGFGHATCISINEEVVNAPPSRIRNIQEGDLVSIALGTEIRGIHGKAARTVYVGDNPPEPVQRLLKGTAAIFEALGVVTPGEDLKSLLAKIPPLAEQYGLSIVDTTGGAGIGKRLHELPNTPNDPTDMEENPILVTGMAFTLMPMMTLSPSGHWVLHEDGWTYVMSDGSLSAHFAETVLMTEWGLEILSRTP